MKKGDVKAHLKGLGTESQIDYLTNVLDKKGLLAKGTQKSVKELLAKGLEKRSGLVGMFHDGPLTAERPKLLRKAAAIREELGDFKKAIKDYKVLKDNEELGRIYESEMNNPSKAASYFLKDPQSKEQIEHGISLLRKSGELTKAAKKSEKLGHYLLAGELWKELGKHERAAENFESVANIEERQKHTRDTGSGRIRFGPQFHGDPKKHQKEAAELYLKANKPRDALRVYGEKAFDMLKKEGNHKLLAEVYDGKGDSLRTKRMTRKANSKSRLTSRLTGVIAIVGVLGGITFLSPSITGNAIAGIAPKGSSFLGIGLLAIGICAGVFSIKRKS